MAGGVKQKPLWGATQRTPDFRGLRRFRGLEGSELRKPRASGVESKKSETKRCQSVLSKAGRAWRSRLLRPPTRNFDGLGGEGSAKARQFVLGAPDRHLQATQARRHTLQQCGDRRQMRSAAVLSC